GVGGAARGRIVERVLVLVPLVLGLVIGVATGGKIGNLADLKFRWPWFVLVVLVVREAVILTPLNQVDGMQYVYAAALAALVAWTALHVKRLPGVWVVTLGAAMNLIVIVANGARMPVAPALATTFQHRGHLGQYVLMSSSTNLNWLADWIGFPWPVRGARRWLIVRERLVPETDVLERTVETNRAVFWRRAVYISVLPIVYFGLAYFLFNLLPEDALAALPQFLQLVFTQLIYLFFLLGAN